jgi:hypothetical protein
LAAKLAQYRENCSSLITLSRWTGLRGLRDSDLDAQCTKASVKLTQPHNTHTNDDGVLHLLVLIALSL